MGVRSRVKPLSLLCASISVTLFLILKTNKYFYKEFQKSVKSGEQWADTSKWKVLSDGTVVHTANHCEQSFKSIRFDINSDVCHQLSDNSLKLLILIESKADNFERRQTIRQTWANKQSQQSLDFRTVFLLGLHPNQRSSVQNQIVSEAKEFEDILQINITESFNKLTLKSVAGLYWYLKWCPSAQFFAKTDDDIFIETRNLIQSINKLENSELRDNSILCHQNKNREIIRTLAKVSEMMRPYRHSTNRLATLKLVRDKISKYKVHYSQLPGLYFPHYCSGFGYAMSAAVAHRLHSTALTIPYLQIEDVFVTGLSRQKANLQIHDTKHLTIWPLVRPTDGKCAFIEGRINSNELSVEDMRTLWAHIKRNTSSCRSSKSNLKKVKPIDNKYIY